MSLVNVTRKFLAVSAAAALLVACAPGQSEEVANAPDGKQDSGQDTAGESDQAPDELAGPLSLVAIGGPGGGSDTFLRELSAAADETFSAPLAIDNQPGGGGLVGWAYTLDQPADGTTVTQVSTLPMITGHIVNSDITLEDFRAVIGVMTDPMVLVVPEDAEWDNAEAFIGDLQSGDELSFSTSGSGAMENIVTHVLSDEAGFTYREVAFEDSSEALTALLGGSVDAYFGFLASVMPQIEAGTVKPLMTSNATTIEVLPDVPTLLDLGYDVSFDQFRGLIVHSDTPDDIVETLHDGFHEAMNSPDFQSYMNDSGAVANYMGAEEYEAFLGEMNQEFAGVVEELGITEE